MNRLNWTLALTLLALVGLLACQGAAFGDDELPLAPMPSDVTAAAYAPPVPTAPAVPTAPSVTVNTPCTACEPGCCGCGCDRHWVVDVEALWLAPIGNQSVAMFETNTSAVVADTTIQEEMTFSPRISFGWQGDCWGFQVQYFQLHQNDPAGLGNGNGNGAGDVEGAAFRAEKLDLLATRLFCYRQTQLQWNGGVCYGQFDQTATLMGLAPGGSDYFTSWSRAKLEFHGVGLTSGLTALRPIGSKNLNFFCKVQTSLLWSNQDFDDSEVRVTYGGTTAASDATAQANTDLFIGEVEAGLQWMAPLKCVPADAFFRVAFDYQYWTTGGIQPVDTFIGISSGGHTGIASAIVRNGSTNLVGLGIAAGITW
jgi:hypothetical protein